MMEQFIKYLFLFWICLAPLGVLAGLNAMQRARQAAAKQNAQQALELRTRALWRFTTAMVDLGIGVLGYYLISRRVFPQIDVMWIFTPLILTSTAVHFWFIRRLYLMRLDLIRRSNQKENPTPQNSSAPQ